MRGLRSSVRASSTLSSLITSRREAAIATAEPIADHASSVRLMYTPAGSAPSVPTCLGEGEDEEGEGKGEGEGERERDGEGEGGVRVRVRVKGEGEG